MSETRLLNFGKDSRKMNFADGLEFIETTRRQLDRFHLLPHAPGQTIKPEDEADIRRQVDELEADILRLMNTA